MSLRSSSGLSKSGRMMREERNELASQINSKSGLHEILVECSAEAGRSELYLGAGC